MLSIRASLSPLSLGKILFCSLRFACTCESFCFYLSTNACL
ncbi:hypothetical protein HMPREF0322_00632 [Desulfitobacterium hafniense DP7]|uniref:Uncharacterized protein n=1 Tax=Desulfitobacterium hafniense DP7 TaxID=537010 RepID=G9XI56_DESHA|nr:hypothetical protein HMPREF0322_00632 [Desulfitobacterium hafniense DP7]